MLLHNVGKEEYVWNIVDPLGNILALPSSEIKVNRELKQPDPDKNTNGLDPSRRKVWVTPPVKGP